MEAVPRLPMLSFEPISYYTKNVQFATDLMGLIRQHYQEEPNNYIEEVQQLEKLRQQATKLSKDVDGVNTLKRYFCQLYFLQKRFPSLKDTTVSPESFWKDILGTSGPRKIDYRSEFTTTLFNIGALHSQLGAADDRTTSEGLKLACTHFQCAAWAFKHLREVTSATSRPEYDHGYLQFLISTCLAQAQECIAEKSITDNRKPSICAKVVTQIGEYYENAKHALSRLIPGENGLLDYGIPNPPAYMNYLQFKQTYYKCIADLFLGMQAEEEEKMGKRVAYFELASDELKEAFRYAKKIIDCQSLTKGVEEALSFTHDVVEGKRKNAVSENEFIYHEDVPAKDNLEKAKGASLVKCIGFDFNDPEISGPDIFSKLISIKVHKLSSVYSEEKAKLLRSVSSSVEEKESELNSFMLSLKLDYLNSAENPNTLPEELIERCAACEAKPTLVQDLISSMNKLNDAHHEVETMMKEVVEYIEKEEKAEEEYQVIMNSAQPLSMITTDLKCEMTRYQEALKKATESNESLRNAVSSHVNNLRILSLPLDSLEKQLPRVSLEYSPEEQGVVQELQRLVDKVEEMKNQRASLMLQLRESLRHDDITDQIALSDEDRGVFSVMVVKEIAKHQNVVNLIEQNLKAQSNILKAITNTYATYAPIRKIISETAHKRGSQINALIESFDVSDDVLKKTAKGLDFYRKLDVNVRKLLSRVKGTCKVREEERIQVYAKTGKKIPRPVSNNSIPPAPVHSSVPAAPKLKDYLAQKMLPKSINDATSLPCNPYYPASSYVPKTAITPSGGVDPNQYYSTVARPPPVGSETTVISSSMVEPTNTKEAKPFVPTNNKVAYPFNYPYGYQIQPSNTTQISGYEDGYPRVEGYANAGVSTTNYQTYNYPQNVYNMAQHQNPSAAGSYTQYPSMQTGKKADVANNTYTPTTSQYSYPNQQTGINNVNQTTPIATAATLRSLPMTYEHNVYGTNAVSSNMYASKQNTSSYASIGPNTYTNFNQSGMHSQNIPNANTMYTVDATNTSSTANYHHYASTTGQNVYIQANTPTVGVPTSIPNAYNQYSITNQPLNYQSSKHAYNHGVTAVYQPQNYAQSNYPNTGSPHPEVISSAPQFTGVDALTYNNSHYTSAGHYYTQNIESSSMSIDGRSYATQYATNVDQPTVATPITSDADQHYYTAQYGQRHESVGESQMNVETSTTKGQDRHSMTYMQADSNGRTKSTYSVNSSSTTSEEKKNESNIDLLADLDFDVTDTPLLPISEAAIANKILEKLSNLNLSSSVESKKEPFVTGENAKTAPNSDPFLNSEYLSKFVLEAEKFEKFVEKLTLKTLNGSIPIDTLWNEYVVEQERISKNQTTEVAQKYAVKNRSPTSVPYDGSRVCLSSESDYINASLIKNPNPTVPNLILTQNPLSCTISDFWRMIWDQDIELIVCLINENEINDDIYWPKEKNEKLEINELLITLHSCNMHSNRIERIFSVHKDNTCRILTHMQIISWQEGSCTKIMNPIIELSDECVSFYYAQRDLGHCIVLHCDTGASRSGLFALLCTFISEIKSGKGVPDLMALLKLMSENKKYLINDKQNLLLAFQLGWCYIHNILMKHKKRSVPEIPKFDYKKEENTCSPTRMTTEPETKLPDRFLSNEESKRRITQGAQSDNDPLSSLDPLWSIKKGQ